MDPQRVSGIALVALSHVHNQGDPEGGFVVDIALTMMSPDAVVLEHTLDAMKQAQMWRQWDTGGQHRCCCGAIDEEPAGAVRHIELVVTLCVNDLQMQAGDERMFAVVEHGRKVLEEATRLWWTVVAYDTADYSIRVQVEPGHEAIRFVVEQLVEEQVQGL